MNCTSSLHASVERTCESSPYGNAVNVVLGGSLFKIKYEGIRMVMHSSCRWSYLHFVRTVLEAIGACCYWCNRDNSGISSCIYLRNISMVNRANVSRACALTKLLIVNGRMVSAINRVGER